MTTHGEPRQLFKLKHPIQVSVPKMRDMPKEHRLTPEHQEALRTWKPQNITFFDLPAELRNRIYLHVFRRDTLHPFIFSQGKECSFGMRLPKAIGPTELVLALTRTCKKVQEELLPFYLANTHFRILYGSFAPRSWYYNWALHTESIRADEHAWKYWKKQPDTLLNPLIYSWLIRAGPHLTSHMTNITISVPFKDRQAGTAMLIPIKISIDEETKKPLITIQDKYYQNPVVQKFLDEDLRDDLVDMLTKSMAVRGSSAFGLPELEGIRFLLEQKKDCAWIVKAADHARDQAVAPDPIAEVLPQVESLSLES